MNKKIRLMIVNDNPESLASIKNLLKPYKDLRITGEITNSNHAVDIALNYQPDILLIDTNMPGLDGFTVAKNITQVAPYIGVILIGHAESIDVMRKAMQSGSGDFLELPFSGTKLYNAITSLYTEKQSQRKFLMDNPLLVPHRNSKVISVFSSKGGVGKTVLSTNVAISLKEQTREQVLLIDMDLQFGDVSDLLNIKPKTNIIDLLADKETLEPNELDKYLISHYSGIKTLAAPDQPEQADLITDQEVNEIISLFLKRFDYIVIDLAPLFNEVVLGSIEKSDHILLITTMEIPTLKNVRGGLEVLKKLNIPKDKITLILNRFQKDREIKESDVKEFLNIQELTCIEDAPELVSSSINLGEPIVQKYKDSLVAKQINALSKSLIDYKNPPTKKNKKSLFQKFLNKNN